MLTTVWKAAMTDVGDDDTQHAATLDAMHRAGFTTGEVWVYYVSLGGSMSEFEVNAYLHGLVQLPAIDRDMLAQSVNEMYDDICRSPRAPFAADIRHDSHSDDLEDEDFEDERFENSDVNTMDGLDDLDR